MGACQYCGQFTSKHCPACLVYCCTAHMPAHYFSQYHRMEASKKSIKLESDGTPVLDE